jgi:hypothetical protein
MLTFGPKVLFHFRVWAEKFRIFGPGRMSGTKNSRAEIHVTLSLTRNDIYLRCTKSKESC